MKSLIYIPVYNQVNELPHLIDELKKGYACDEILLINNASTDGSEELLAKSGLNYFSVPKNRGVGYSNMLALDWAIERGYQIFGTMASNGKMLPSEMSRILNPLINGEADYVTGSRFTKGGDSPHLPVFRKLSIPMVNLFLMPIIGTYLSDSTCGYRAYKVDIIKKSIFDWHAKWLETYEFEYYIYAKVILNRKIRYKEVPITMKYPVSKKNYSKIPPLIGWWAMIKPWLMAKVDGKKIEWN